MAAALALAGRICARVPIAVQVAKQMINVAEGEENAGVMEMFAGSLTACTADLMEGFAVFRDKRPPEFTNS